MNDSQREKAYLAEFKRIAGLDRFVGSEADHSEESLRKDLEEIAAFSISDPAIPGAILPRPLGQDIMFYCVAPTPQLWRQLRPLLLAFAGPTLTDFTGLPADLDQTDPVEAWLAHQGFAAVARLRTTPKTRKATVMALRRLVASLRQAEIPERIQILPTSLLLQRFRLALLGPDKEVALEVLRHLESELRLDALNLAFLKVQLHAACADWEALRAESWFQSLCLTRRPPAVTAALVEAIYQTELAILADDPRSCDRYFREQVRPSTGDLFRQLPPKPSSAVLKTFALEVISANPPRQDLLPPLTAAASADPEFAAFWAGLETVFEPAPQPSVPGEPARMASLEILRALASGAADCHKAREALLLAEEVDSLEGYALARRCVEALPESDQVALLSKPWMRELWRQVLSASGDRLIQGWADWLRAIGDPAFDQALAVAERGCYEWPVEQQLADARPVSELVEALEAVTGAIAQARLQEALPLLVDWLRQDPRYPCRLILPLYCSLLNLIALNPGRSEHDLAASSLLAEALLVCGLSPEDYRDLLDALLMLANVASGRRGMDWLLDMVDLTLVHPAPDPAERQRLWYGALAILRPLAHALNPVQFGLLRFLSQSLGMPVPEGMVPLPSELAQPPALTALRGMRLAIYTLTERAGRQAAELLRTWVPDLTVELNHDHVGSPALKALAESADIFVVVTHSAKHAATGYIQQHRPRGRPILFPAGRGASSILAKIQEFAGSLTGAVQTTV